MLSWAQIIVLILAIFACVITVSICDYTIIKEIVKLRKALLRLLKKKTRKRVKK